jgi:regulatory protein
VIRSPKYGLLEAKQKIESYCAYQERCDAEIRKKLASWFMDAEHVDVLISDLISNNFLNEERFAEAYVSGKFRIKKWGRVKIKRELKSRKISDYSIDKAIKQIDEEEYLETLKSLLEKKNISGQNQWEKKAKLKRFLSSKGYESNLIYDLLDKLNSSK